MSQDWDSSLYVAVGKSADLIMTNIELMLKTLRSMFSGASEPSNPVAGQGWSDTGNSLFKLRNTVNNAWLSAIDLVTGRAKDADKCSQISVNAGTGLSGGGALSADRTISHASHTGDVTGSNALTIGDGKVTAPKLASDMVPVLTITQRMDADTSNPWTIIDCYVLVPNGASTLSVSFFNGGTNCSLYLNGTLMSGFNVGTHSQDLDVSGMSGVVPFKINAATGGYISWLVCWLKN